MTARYDAIVLGIGTMGSAATYHLVYFAPTRPALFGPDRCPNYSLNVPEGYYYGIPNLPGEELKIGRHDRGEACALETARRSVSDREVNAMRAILDTYMPGAAGEVREVSTCLSAARFAATAGG